MTHGATLFDPNGPLLSADEKVFFRDADPYGFILFARHIENADQLRRLCGDLREAVGRNALITIDQEGGRVQRLRPPLAQNVAPALDHAKAAGPRAQEAFYLRYRLIAAELRDLGIDSNCAPLADLACEDTHPFLRNRCFGTSVQEVIDLARACANGLLDGGVLPVLKHLPGHGRAKSDSHLDLPHVTAGLEELEETDFACFRALHDLPLGMTAHVTYEALDKCPATVSSKTMAYIRQEMGFDGLMMSDDITMQALDGDLATRTQAAIAAGCDLVLLCNATQEQRETVAQQAQTLSDTAQERAKRVEQARQTPDAVDIPQMIATLDEIGGWRGDG